MKIYTSYVLRIGLRKLRRQVVIKSIGEKVIFKKYDTSPVYNS